MVKIVEDEMDDLINRYFHLDKAIKQLNRRLYQLHLRHRTQSYYTRIEPTDEYTLQTKSYRIDEEVAIYLDASMLIEKRIANLKKKQRYFNDYLVTISPEAQECLFKRYLGKLDVTVNDPLIQALYEELLEIEDAICFMNGRIPELRFRDNDSENLNFEDMLNILGV